LEGGGNTPRRSAPPLSRGELIEEGWKVGRLKNHPALWASPAYAGSVTLLNKEGSLMD